MKRDRCLVFVGLVVLVSSPACKYENRPAPGAMVCGLGAKTCPDGYSCYRGSTGSNCTNTCWPGRSEPEPATVCAHGGVLTDNTDRPDAGRGGADGRLDGSLNVDGPDGPDAPRDFGATGGQGDDGGGSPDTGPPMGTPAALSISPDMKDFGTVVAGVFAEASFQVSNSGGQASSIPTVTIDGMDAALFTVSMTTCMAAIPAMGKCLVTVRFSPTATSLGTRSANLNVTATLGGAVTATLQGTAVPQGALTITPTTQAFGALLQGTPGTPVSFTVKNTGGAATGALATAVQNSTELAIATDGCLAKVLASGETCTLAVTFTPASAGQKSGTLVVTATPGGTTSASLTGVGLAPASLTIDPASGAFATTAVGATGGSQTFKITNNGGVAAGGTTAVAAVVGGTNPSDFVASANGCTGVLMPGASCMVTLTFKPSAVGARTATLTASASPGGMVPASLSGAGVNPALLKLAVASGASTDFGSVVTGNSATQTFTLTNTGGQPASAVTVAATGAGFSVAAPGAGDCVSGTTTLAVNASCSIHVVLSSVTVGAVSGSVTASASTGGSSALTLSGAIVSQGSIGITPKTAAFGSFLPNNPSAAIPFSVTNGGGSTTPVLATAISGSTEFTISADTCNTKPLAAGASCSLSVVFKPASSGGKTGSLTLTAGIAGNAAATLTGTGLVNATLALSTPAGFGSLVVNQSSPAQALTVTNSGDVASGMIVPALSGTNAADFTVTGTTCGTTLAGKGTCTVSVVFKPLTAGTGKTATLTVSATPGGAPSASLTGTGLADASLDLTVASGSSNEFGSLVMSSGTQTEQFVVTNTGQRASTALTVALTGTDFRLVAPTGLDCVSAPATNATVLAPNASCTIRVTFAPTAALSRTATLSVSAATGGSDSLTTLHGTGVPPSALTVSSSTLNLGSVLQGGKSTTPGTITVTNTGGVATGAITTAIPAGEFTIASDNCKGTSLIPTGACTIGISFSPTSASATPKAATLTVTAVSGASRTVTLSGTGASLQVDVTSFVFPATPTGTAGASRSFTVTNPTTGSSGTLGVTLTGTGTADFALSPGTCTGVLGGTGICSVLVTFRPGGQSFGLRTAMLNVTANPGGTATVALSGQGQAQDGQFGCVNNIDCVSQSCGTFYLDSDGDGYGNLSRLQRVCGFTAPNGYVSDSGDFDCDDADVGMYPGIQRCQSATARVTCLASGTLQTDTCAGGACRDDACVGTVNMAGVLACFQAGTCTTAQGCDASFSGPPVCGPGTLTCDDGSDCPAGSVCCSTSACVAFIQQACYVGSCPVGDSCTHYIQMCNPLASDCPAGVACSAGGVVNSVSGQGRWFCAN